MCEAQFIEFFVEEKTKVLASVSKHASISRTKAPCSELTTKGAGQSQKTRPLKTKNICRQNSSKRRKWGRFQQAKILQLTLIDGEEEGVKQKQADAKGREFRIEEDANCKPNLLKRLLHSMEGKSPPYPTKSLDALAGIRILVMIGNGESQNFIWTSEVKKLGLLV